MTELDESPHPEDAPDDLASAPVIVPRAAGLPISVLVWLALLIAATQGGPALRKVPLLVPMTAVTSTISLLGFVVAGRLVGARLTEFSLFIGPVVWERMVGETRLALRWLPSGGFVSFQGMKADEPLEAGSYRSLHPVLRALVALSGPAFLLLLAVILLGGTRAVHSFLTAFPQFVQLLFSPLSAGKLLVLRYLELVSPAQLPLALGVLAAKFAAWNCLPIPTFNGGQALIELIRGRRNWDKGVDASLAMIGMLVQGLAFLAGGVAVVGAFFQR